jgi:hypothetical protein
MNRSRSARLLAALAGATLLAGLGGAFIHPAHAQERERRAERHDERYRHDERRGWRFDRERHERRWGGRDYGYDVPSYGVVPPPLVYAPPPPPPGIDFLFSFR